jgi:hypothetical protein
MILFMTPDRAGIEAGKSLEFLDATATGESRVYLLNPAAAISNRPLLDDPAAGMV